MESTDLLNSIPTNEGFARDLITAFPSIEADVYSFRSNQNCSCKNRLLKHINSNIDRVTELYKKNSTDSESIPQKQDQLVNMSGQVVEIEPNPMKYKNLIEYMNKNGKTYKGLTVMDSTNAETGKDVWLVFFY